MYRISRSAHARDLEAGGREPEVEGDGSRVDVAIDKQFVFLYMFMVVVVAVGKRETAIYLKR